MNNKLNVTSLVISILISLTLILTAINPTAAYASASADDTTPPVPTATPMPESVITETPMPTATPVETVPALYIQPDPTYIIPGGQVTLSYQITEFEKLSTETLLRFYAPIGLVPANPEDGIWDETSGTFDLTIIASEGKILWLATETITPPVTISAELIQGEEIISKAEVLLDALTEFKVEPVGGEVLGMNGNVQVTFPGGAVSETVQVKVTRPSEEALPVPSLSGSPFEITAVSESSKAEVSQFAIPVEIVVVYSDSSLNGAEENPILYWYDPSDGQWKLPLSQQLDAENNRIIATTDHFTVFDTYNADWQGAETPTLSFFQTPGFTGAASFSLPIKVPPGPGGFQPSLTLSYNSQTVDSSSSNSQASWAGMGWSVGNSYIERNTHGTQGEGNQGADDTFELLLNGAGMTLYKDTSGDFHASDENFYKIEFDTVNNIWTVWDKSGTQYIFAHLTRNLVYKDNQLHQVPWRYSLSTVRNKFGREITYTYATETKGFTTANGTVTSATWVYPESITYANGKYRIFFDRIEENETTKNPRKDLLNIWSSAASYQAFQRSLLEAIRVEHYIDGDWTLIRKYQFTYCQTEPCSIFPKLVWDQGGRTPTLVSVQEFGMNGTSLPAYTFHYDDDMHLTSAENGYNGGITFEYNDTTEYNDAPENAWYETEGEGANPLKFKFNGASAEGWAGSAVLDGNGNLIVFGTAYNQTVKSFQPGRWYKAMAKVRASGSSNYIQFGYAYKDNGVLQADHFDTSIQLTSNWVWVESEPFYLPVNTTQVIPKLKSGGMKVDEYYLVPLLTFSRVTARIITGGSTPYTYTYEYEGADSNTPRNTQYPDGISEAAGGPYPYSKPYSEFRGHQFVTATDPYGATTRTEFCQDDYCTGSPLITEFRDSSGLLLQKNESNYDYQQWAAATLYDCETLGCSQPFDTLYYRFVFLDDETSTIYRADGSTEAGSLTTDYEYEFTYGNLVSQEVSGTGLTTLTTHYEYYENVSGDNYLVDLPLRIHVTKAVNVVLADTRYVYDTVHQQDGILIKTRVLMVDGSPDQYSQVSYGYDSWGNVTSLRTWTGYGTENADPTTGAQTTYTCYGENDAVSGCDDSQNAALSSYHTYPLWVKNVAEHVTTFTYDTALGLPISVTDPNDATTSATYDGLGRFLTLTRPDTGNDVSPSITVSYSTPPSFDVTLTLAVDTTNSYQIVRSYDGLGRPTSVTAGGTTTLYEYEIQTENNIKYRVDKVSSPFAGTEAYFWAETKYDALGRPLSITAPDGTISQFSYDGFETTVTDPNDNVTETTADILGRTIFVDAPTGPDITFEYDDVGNLISATRGSATTKMKYDLGGRKIGIDDADMGTEGDLDDDYWAWDYQYDALGNLLTQTDARGCTLTLTYDSLNRLDTKTSSGTYCGQQVSVDYDYDAGTNGKGRRTSMEDDSGSTSWEYDERGRLKSESKNITGHLSPFVTEWTYNSADLPITMTYPDEEVVTFEYNDRMLLENVEGLSTYVFDVQYDSAGRMTSRELGNGLTQIFGYYDWDEQVNNIGQGGRLETLTTESLQNLSYMYDSIGNVSQITNSIANETSTYEYDSMNRLTSWTLNSQTKNYDYDAAGNLWHKEDETLQYNDTNHVHAVTDANGNSYEYDANGNQTVREIGNDTYELNYDAENRLVEVKKNEETIALFTFDGDGRRVKSVADGETILFVGGYFEKKGTEITKYYPGGAVRKYVIPQSMNVEYILGDHLGSASVMTDSLGNKVSEMRYSPWGDVRYYWVDSNLSTTPAYTLPKQTFTGQYSYMDDPSTTSVTEGFGLMFYNARWYDPALGRFAQADSIVPGGMQGLDRYAYANNNPANYTDSSGHSPTNEECGFNGDDCKPNNDCTDPIYCEGGKPRSPEEVKIIKSTVIVAFGQIIPNCIRPNGDLCFAGTGGLGTVVGDPNTIVTAYHTLENYGGTPPSLVLKNAKGDYVIIPWEEVEYRQEGDLLIITLPEGLSGDFATPATPTDDHKFTSGQEIVTTYQDESGIHTTRTNISEFPWAVGRYLTLNYYAENPEGILNKGDSGGGVYYNGEFVGVNSLSGYWFWMDLMVIQPY